MKKNRHFYFFIIVLLMLRMTYGLAAEFWEPDEFYTFLLGLKFYSRGLWPYFGPLVVYTKYQIPGALQAILTGGPLFLFPIPEAPTVFLNMMTFSSLGLLAWYFEKRVEGLPGWLIWGLVMTLSWSVQFGTRIINPSYLLVFSILFFIGFFETMPLYQKKLISAGLSFFMMGIAVTCSMQLHLSWILLIPFIIAVLITKAENRSLRLTNIVMLGAGGLAGLLTLIPTLLVYGLSGYQNATYLIVFHKDNLLNFSTILFRFLSFSTFEVQYFAGTPTDRFIEMRLYPWMVPSTLIVLAFSFVQIAFFIVSFFLKRNQRDWKYVKWISFFSVLLIFLTFFFSEKGPSSHTFYILYPVSLFYSMYCYQYIYSKYRHLKFLFIIVLFSGAVFLAGLGCYKYDHKSLYINRPIVQKAIHDKDYRLIEK